MIQLMTGVFIVFNVAMCLHEVKRKEELRRSAVRFIG